MATEIEKSEQMRIKRMPKMATARNRIGQDTEALIAKLDEGLQGERTLHFESRFESGNLFLA